MSDYKLTAKQEQFCQEYLIDLNATQAAIRAGYSQDTAFSIGSENLRKPDVVARLAELKKKRAEKVEISQDEVLAIYRRLAQFDTRKLYNDDGTPKHPTELDDETALAINSVEHGENGYKYKASDKKGVADSLARHLGMFDDSLTVKLPTVSIKDFTGKKDTNK